MKKNKIYHGYHHEDLTLKFLKENTTKYIAKITGAEFCDEILEYYKNIAILTQYILLILTQLYNSRSCSKKASNTLTKPEEYFEEIIK